MADLMMLDDDERWAAATREAAMERPLPVALYWPKR